MYRGKKLPPTILRKIEEIKGKTLNRNSTTGHYIDRNRVDYGRHEIDWMLLHGVMTRTFNSAKFVSEFKLSPDFD